MSDDRVPFLNGDDWDGPEALAVHARKAHIASVQSRKRLEAYLGYAFGTGLDRRRIATRTDRRELVAEVWSLFGLPGRPPFSSTAKTDRLQRRVDETMPSIVANVRDMTFEVLVDAAQRGAVARGLAVEGHESDWVEHPLGRASAMARFAQTRAGLDGSVPRSERALVYLPAPPFTPLQIQHEAEAFAGATLTASLYTADAMLQMDLESDEAADVRDRVRVGSTQLVRDFQVAELLGLQRWSDAKLDMLSASFADPVDGFVRGGYDDKGAPPILSAVGISREL
jgi:hypothetical protein